VNVGGLLSFDHDTVRDVVEVLLHPSIAVKVLVWEVIHPTVVCAPSACDTVGVLQLSVAVAVPKAAFNVGLFGLPQINKVVPVAVINGACKSSVHVTVLDVLAVFPQPSTKVQLLVCERLHPVLVTGPSVCVIVGVPQASVEVAEPNAASKAAGDKLQPGVNVVPFAVIEAVLSNVHVTVLDVVEVLLQASLAVNVLVWDLPQLLLCKAPSENVTVVGPHASVAVAVPSAAVISVAAGLHPRASDVPVAVRFGGVRSAVQETVREIVDVLPQPSIAVNVLVCDAVQPVVLTAPSDDVIVGVLHPSVAVAFANAVLIAPAVGLQPSVVLE